MDSTAQMILAFAGLVSAVALLLRSQSSTIEGLRKRVTELEGKLETCEKKHDAALEKHTEAVRLCDRLRDEVKELRGIIQAAKQDSLVSAAAAQLGDGSVDVVEEPARRARRDGR